ncbi:hypothetical protein GF312_15555 [Candidatus Poribacteria bacterium]|nr:hypothetical protein [Candidatus Poribacteria bacterium]
MKLTFKFFLLFSLLLLFLPSTILARKDTGPPEWAFDDPMELADWRDFHNIDPASVSTVTKVRDKNGFERSVLRVVSIDDDPYIYPGGSVPSWEPFDAYDYPTIYIGVRVQETDIWRVDYVTSTDGLYNEEKSQTFRVEAEDDFVDLEFKMHWQYMVKGFRIHTGTNRNIVSEIDYVSLRGPMRVTQNPKRLATTWGRIKDLL